MFLALGGKSVSLKPSICVTSVKAGPSATPTPILHAASIVFEIRRRSDTLHERRQQKKNGFRRRRKEHIFMFESSLDHSWPWVLQLTGIVCAPFGKAFGPPALGALPETPCFCIMFATCIMLFIVYPCIVAILHCGLLCFTAL